MDYLTIVLVCILIFLLIVFAIKSKVVSVMSHGLKLGFIIFFITAFISLIFPSIFTYMADFSLRQVGVYENLKSIDSSMSVESITKPAENLWDGFQNMIGNSPDTSEKEASAGMLEKSVYPNLVNLVAVVFRILTTAFSFLGIVVIIYLSYAAQGMTAYVDLQKKVEMLEKRVREVEKIKN